MSTKTTQPPALADILQIVLRFRWKFIVPIFITMTAVLAASLFLPRKYKMEAIFERRTDMVLTEIMNRGAPQNIQDPRQSLTEEISGQIAVDAALDALKPLDANRLPGNERANRDRLREELLRKVTISSDIASNDMDRVRITYVANDAEWGRRVVNTLVEKHIERTRGRIEGRLKRSSEFFRNEVERSRAQIEELENKKLTFEIMHGNLLPEMTTGVSNGRGEFQSQLTLQQMQRDSMSFKLDTLSKSLELTPETTPAMVTGINPERTRLETRLRDLTAQLNINLGSLKMTERHPEVITLKEQISQVEQEIEETPVQIILHTQLAANHKRIALESMMNDAAINHQTLSEQIRSTKKHLAQAEEETARLFPVRSEYLKIIRLVNESQRQLTFWEDNLRRIDMAMAAENGDRGIQYSFIKPCGPVSKPISPNLAQSIAVAIALGILAGMVSVFLAHRADESFSDGEQLSDTIGLPLFGNISEIISNKQKRANKFKAAVIYPLNITAMASVVLLMSGLLYLDLEKPQTLQEFKKHPGEFIRQQISFLAVFDGGRENK